MKRFTITVLLSGLLAVPFLVPQTKAAELPSEPVRDVVAEIKALQKERIAALTGVVEILLVQYQHGGAEFRALALAQTDLLAAEFDATDDANERIVLLERELKVATDALDTAERKVQAGRANAVESLQAKALVLDIKRGQGNCGRIRRI
jgi:hypothetical protein